ELDETGAISDTPAGTSFTTEPKGWLAGGHAGYNWQAANWVFGIEVSGSWANLEETKLVPLPDQFDDTFTTKIESLLLVTGRLGYAWDSFLIFVKGGYAGAKVRGGILDSITGTFQVGTAPNTWESDKWQNGWTVGAGAGLMLWRGISLEVDYNF